MPVKIQSCKNYCHSSTGYAASGSYLLVFGLPEKITVEVGALGRIQFLPGLYAYAGSARANLPGRIKRHCRKEKKNHWHIDYLTTRPEIQWIELIVVADLKWSEHDFIRSAQNATHPIARFGSGDCRSGCESHLVFWKKIENYVNYRDALSIEKS
jgi:Uri superfamily endonuclease